MSSLLACARESIKRHIIGPYLRDCYDAHESLCSWMILPVQARPSEVGAGDERGEVLELGVAQLLARLLVVQQVEGPAAVPAVHNLYTTGGKGGGCLL